MRALAILAALALAVPAAAQQRDPKAGPPPTDAELQRATDTLNVFVSAFNDARIPAETKAGLLMCLYDNPLGEIAEKTARVFAANKTANPKSAAQRLYIIIGLCHAPLAGLKPSK